MPFPDNGYRPKPGDGGRGLGVAIGSVVVCLLLACFLHGTRRL